MNPIESKKFESLPLLGDLETAFFWNQEIWRARGRLTSISSPLELPYKITSNVFDTVDGKFYEFQSEFHLKHKPLVGYGVLPAVIFDFERPYYYPNLGKLRLPKLFNEVGTDWLTNIALGTDPIKNNNYWEYYQNNKPEQVQHVGDLLLYEIMRGIENHKLTYGEVTDIFARILISGDSEFMRDFIVRASNSERYKNIIMPVSELDLLDDLEKILSELKNNTLIKPAVFVANSMFQLTAQNLGQTWIPGVVCLSGSGLTKHTLAHEYIHSLSYHEYSWGGIPIEGYRKVK